MSLEITPSIAKRLPATVKTALSKMPGEEQAAFQQEFQKKSKSTVNLVLLAILLPVFPLFILGKTGLAWVFLLTGFGCGVWYVIEWFLTPGRVRDYNDDLATKILSDLKIMSR